MRYQYWAEGNELWVGDTERGGVSWHGQPDGERVLKAITLPDLEDGIVLLHYEAYRKGNLYGRSRNLVRCRHDGAIVWMAEAPDIHDMFTDIHITEAGLFAFSWSCYSNRIDEETGKIINSVFTK